MGSFMEDLWASVFTPGPTPTLLVAANATFAALQLVLFLLLLATYSIHFVVLSALSASLWWSINWFAQELAAVQAQEAKEKTESKELLTEEDDDDKRKSEASRKTPGALDSTESDTETESLMERKISAVSAAAPPSTTAAATTTTTTLQPPEQQGGIRKRPSMSGESSGYVSTDSEWEKVDDKTTS
ncbi:putative ER membrane protein [Aspergillus novoparasiticus]|uniref:Putative ER membrane protein n=1 Tax=Aspergillus novoparasiticus TaxID=986946 RepID=A0A5N6ETV4_9EURO|nr:putative ER membrane protein [Aspergillus novoparasiticus]